MGHTIRFSPNNDAADHVRHSIGAGHVYGPTVDDVADRSDILPIGADPRVRFNLVRRHYPVGLGNQFYHAAIWVAAFRYERRLGPRYDDARYIRSGAAVYGLRDHLGWAPNRLPADCTVAAEFGEINGADTRTKDHCQGCRA